MIIVNNGPGVLFYVLVQSNAKYYKDKASYTNKNQVKSSIYVLDIDDYLF